MSSQRRSLIESTRSCHTAIARSSTIVVGQRPNEGGRLPTRSLHRLADRRNAGTTQQQQQQQQRWRLSLLAPTERQKRRQYHSLPVYFGTADRVISQSGRVMSIIIVIISSSSGSEDDDFAHVDVWAERALIRANDVPFPSVRFFPATRRNGQPGRHMHAVTAANRERVHTVYIEGVHGTDSENGRKAQ